MVDILETVSHGCWDYRMAHRAWDLSIGIINTMKKKQKKQGRGNHLIGNMGFFLQENSHLT